MFVTIGYTATDPADDAADPHILDIAVDQAVADVGLVNAWRPLPRVIFANIPKTGSRTLVGALQTDLRLLPASFIISCTSTGWAIGRSADVPLAKTDATSDF